MTLRAVYFDSYKSTKKDKNGKEVLDELGRKTLTTKFIYTIEDSEENVKAYLEAKQKQGYDMFDQATGKALFFTPTFYGNDITLKITTNNNVVVDTSEIDRAKSFVESAGGNWSQVVAQKAMQELNFSNIFSAPAKKKVTTPLTQEENATLDEIKAGLDESLDNE